MTNHQSKPNSITMHPLIIVTLLFGSQVLCKPNSSTNQQQPQQQLLQASTQRTVASAADYDKQLIRKAIDDTNLSANNNNVAHSGNRNINIYSNSNNKNDNGNSNNNNNNISNNQDQSNRIDSQTLTTNNSALNFQCPEQFGYYTDTRDCTKYYVCVFGEVLHESCTGGLRFSRELQTCDWPRNVDCPQQQQQQLLLQQQQQSDENNSPSTSSSNGGGSGATSLLPPTTTIASVSSSTINNQQGSSFKQNHNQLVNNAKESSSIANDGSSNSDGEERSLKGSSSLVFADEGSDPQQPSFDEAISPVITVDGAIHLHDGSGGTYSLTPNHNRPIQASTGRQQQESPNQSVDVFVKPLLTQSQTTGNQRQSKQLSSTSTQQLTTTSSSNLINNNNNRQGSSSKILPATLPDQKIGQQIRQQQQPSSNNNNAPQPIPPQSKPLNSVNSFSNDDNNNSKNSNEDASNYESDTNGEDLVNDSISAQADQESNENQDSNGSSLIDGESDTRSPLPLNSPQSPQHSSGGGGGYIPPVLAQNNLRQVSASNRQSSQLLSINNRQLDNSSSRRSFKPILAPNLHSSTSNINSNSNNNNANNQDQDEYTSPQINQRGKEFAAPFSNINNDQDSLPEDARQILPSNLRQQSGFNSRQNQTNYSNQQPQQHQNLIAAQNSRPSRMSSPSDFNHAPQQSQFISSNQVRHQMLHNNNNNNNNRLLSSSDQTLSSNVNFNDSSKLIRLQASHFEKQPIQVDNPQVNSATTTATNPFPKFPSPGSRSQNVLFSQPQPFGFIADNNNNINNNNNNNNNNNDGVSGNNHGHGGALQDFRAMSHQENLHGGSDRNSFNGNGLSSSHSSSSTFSSNNQANVPLLQQQRRPRPPKRQQIPSGSIRPKQQQQQQLLRASNNNNNNNQLIDVDTLPPTMNTITTTTLPITTTTNNGGFLMGPGNSRSVSSFLDQIDDSSTEGPPLPIQASTRGQSLPIVGSQVVRPIVAPTTVNFQQQDVGQHSANTFPTTPSTTTIFTTATSSGNRGRNFNNNFDNNIINQREQQREQSNLRNFQNQGQQRNNAQLISLPPSNINKQQQAGLEQPPLSMITTSNSNSNLNLNLNPNSNPNPNLNLNVNLNPTIATATATTSTNSNVNLDSNQKEQDSLNANRYLNSNIDSSDPVGQPFGTVDYDFDILNDNSTERRNPSSTSLQSQPQLRSQLNNNSFNQTSSSNLNANNRLKQQRQRQQQTSSTTSTTNGLSNQDSGGDDEGENISLTNGQPNSATNQVVGLNSRGGGGGGGSSSSNTGRVRGGQGNSRQQVNQQQQQFNQQDSFASPNQLPQQTTSSSSSPSLSLQQQQQQNAPTKKPRPTNKKINVNHEQAIANTRASTEPARRPEALFATPNALQTATKCDNRVCRLPDCKCGDTLTPGGLDPKVIPQVVLLTFDDAVNDLNWEIYEELFTGRTNPNGCPVLATFYVSHEWTDYGQVQTLYSRGHEMASHSITHSFGEKFSKSQWFKEVNGQREILNMYGGVKLNDVRGMRAPFLQIGGNKMFEMLYDANFTYDSSMPIFENSPPLWPYTLDYQLTHECMITPCPSKSFPGVWEVGMTMWVDLRGGRCSMGDACSNPSDEDGVYEMLMKNFNRHYKSNRAPFGLFYHSAWFNTVHHRRGFLRFMGTVNSLSDVYFVTNWQMLQWMRKPTPLSEIISFEPWHCPAKNDRPPPCFHPSVCNVKSEHGTRFMKTCQPCPANQQYPWVGSTGFKGKQAGGSGSG